MHRDIARAHFLFICLFDVSESAEKLQCLSAGWGKQQGLVCGLIDVHDLVKSIVYSFLSFPSLHSPQRLLQSRNARLLSVLSFCRLRCGAGFLKNLYIEECEASYSFFHVFENVQRLQCVCAGRGNKEGLDSGL